MTNGGETLEACGWRVAVDRAAGEIHLEHEESGDEYVLDGDGGLRVPGGGTAGGDLEAMRDRLAAALDDGSYGPAVPDGGTVQDDHVEYDENSRTLSLSSPDRIRLDASTIELTGTDVTVDGVTVGIEASGSLDLDATGQANISSSGVLSLDGSLITLN